MGAVKADMAKDKVTIDLHNGWSRAGLRLAAIAVPYWAIAASIVVLHQICCLAAPLLGGHAGGLMGWHDFFWFAFWLTVGSVTTYLSLGNKITITPGQLKLPPFPYWSERIKSEDLIATTLTADQKFGKYTHLTLKLKENNLPHSLNSVDLKLSQLTEGRLSQFLRAVEREAPSCAVEPGLESKAFSSQTQQAEVGDRSELTIPYRAHAKLNEFRLLLLAHEKYFWRTWLGFWAFVAIASSPIVCCAIASDVLGGFLQNSAMVTKLARIYETVVRSIVEAGTLPVQTYYNTASTPLGTALLIALASLGLLSLVKLLCQPNELKLSSVGLTLRLRSLAVNLFQVAVPWSLVTQVRLIKPSHASTAESWLIAVYTNSGRPLMLQFAALGSADDKKLFLQCLDRWAPKADRDPELILALTPAQKRSYTELWLQSLSTPPTRNRLDVLGAGQSVQEGRYVIQKQLGIGGQGVAYLAEDLARPDEKIVLKEFVLPVYVEKQVRKQALQKFEHEARMLQNLDHPHIVGMRDYFVEDHRGYLVLEHIDGASLRYIIEASDSTPLYPQEWAMDLALQMCSILEYLHGLAPPIVHRDFTPDNLIFNSSGILKLIDFNVAQQKESTKTGTVVGKHAYLPPEQFRGKPTTQSDIYAMGATLFFVLSGTDPEPLMPSNPIESRKDVHPSLSKIVEKCTQPDSSKRYADVAQIRGDLLDAQREIQLNMISQSGQQILKGTTRSEELAEMKAEH